MSEITKLHIVSGNFFNYLDGKDLIVNSNNKYMLFGSGICGQIYKKAGVQELESYCKNNFSGNMKVNEVRFTPGFKLGIDILHIYCPKYLESTNPYKELMDSYRSLFESAANKGYKNIISISLGTGHHAYKHEDIGYNVYECLKELVNKYDVDFTLVLPDDNTLKYYSLKEK